jgi:hypothetical protein
VEPRSVARPLPVALCLLLTAALAHTDAHAQLVGCPLEVRGVTMVRVGNAAEWGAAVVRSAPGGGVTVEINTGTPQAVRIRVRSRETTATVGGKPVTLPQAPFQSRNATYVPLRFLVESVGATLAVDSPGWVTITHNGKHWRFSLPAEPLPAQYSAPAQIALARRQEKLGDQRVAASDSRNALRHYLTGEYAVADVRDMEEGRGNPTVDALKDANEATRAPKHSFNDYNSAAALLLRAMQAEAKASKLTGSRRKQAAGLGYYREALGLLNRIGGKRVSAQAKVTKH